MTSRVKVAFNNNSTFNAEDTAILVEFLYHIGPDACNAIREISIKYYQAKNADKAFKLLAQCGSLREIYFGMTSRYWKDTGYGRDPPLLRRPGMQPLLRVRGTEKLDVEFFFGGPHGWPTTSDAFERQKERVVQALQILKIPRDLQEQRTLPSNELWSQDSCRNLIFSGSERLYYTYAETRW